MNKHGREASISTALRDLTPWLSRLQMYREAYQESDQMVNLVGEVHRKIQEFSEESCRYFNRSPFGMQPCLLFMIYFNCAISSILGSHCETPKLGVDIKVGEIKDAIFQVTSEGLAQCISHYEGMSPSLHSDLAVLIALQSLRDKVLWTNGS